MSLSDYRFHLPFYWAPQSRGGALLLAATWVICHVCPPAWAQPSQEASPWLSHTWMTDDGLPNNDVNAVVQARDGSMLFGTRSGLARFDGWRLLRDPIELGGPARQGVNAMLSAKDGSLWVMRSALTRYKNGVSTIVSDTDVGSERRPTAFFEASDGAIWMSFENGWAFRIQDQKPATVAIAKEYPQPVPQPVVSMVAEDGDGTIWACGSGVLARWNQDRFVRVAELPKGPSRICRSKDRAVWVVSGQELFKYHETTGLLTLGRLPPQPPGYKPSALLEDRRGRLWLGGYVGGLHTWKDGVFQKVPLSNADVWSLCEDHEGNLWVGTAGGGVCLVRKRVLSMLETLGAPVGQTVRSMCVDARGSLWLAMQTGAVYLREAGVWRHLQAPDDWPGPLATCLTADAFGNVWIAASENRLIRWREGRFETEVLPPAPPGKTRIRAIHASPTGRIWLSRGDAVLAGTPGRWTTHPIPEGTGEITTFAEAPVDTLWAGTNRGRLMKMVRGEFQDVTPAELKTNAIRTLMASDDETLWLGTNGAGIGRLKHGRFAQVGPSRGLLHPVVSQMRLDSQGRVWGAGDGGIFLVSLEDLQEVAEGRKTALRCRSFGATEGAPSIQANSGYAPNSLIAPDGRLWFASRSGVVVADPSVPGGSTAPPPVGFEEIFYNGTSVWRRTWEPSTKFTIGPHVASMRVLLSAQSFTSPENVILQHRLAGRDDDWVTTPRDRIASYGRLPPGTYSFHARAMNHDGVWSDRDAVISVTVSPGIWERPWVQVLASLAAACVIALLVNAAASWRIRRQNELLRHEVALREERARIARDMHDQVGASLTELCMLSDLARRQGATPQLDRLARTARKAVADMDEIVWAVNPEHDDLASLLDYVAQQVLDQTAPAGIRCRLEIPDPGPNRSLTAEFRHHVLLVVREAVNNAVKHASAQEVRVQVRLSDDGLDLTVSDDGTGMTDSPRSGNGLKNMSARAAALKGRLTFATTPHGTTVQFYTPWPLHPPLQ